MFSLFLRVEKIWIAYLFEFNILKEELTKKGKSENQEKKCFHIKLSERLKNHFSEIGKRKCNNKLFYENVYEKMKKRESENTVIDYQKKGGKNQ